MQQTLVAGHQQRGFGVPASHSDTNSSDTPVSAPPTGTSGADAVARSPKPDQPHAEGHRNKQPAPEQNIKRTVSNLAEAPRASRSASSTESVKFEIKDFDVGRRPAEVVGTVDVVQRFDNNLDGRVDQLESQRAARARYSSFTYAARGRALSRSPSIAKQVQARGLAQSVFTSVAPALSSAPASQPG